MRPGYDPQEIKRCLKDCNKKLIYQHTTGLEKCAEHCYTQTTLPF